MFLWCLFVCIGDYFILSENIGGCQRKGFGTVWNKNKKKGWCFVPCGYGCIGANVILSKKRAFTEKSAKVG